MSTKNLLIRLEILLLIFSLFGCEKIGNETDPAKIILGKWRIVEMGNWPNLDPVQSEEYYQFFPDSVKIEYAPDINQTTQKLYWIDSLLNECIYNKVENKCTVSFKFYYEFYDKNKMMRLDYKGIALYKTAIYRRLK